MSFSSNANRLQSARPKVTRSTTSGGSIELVLARVTAGNVEATTSGGGISTDIPVTSTVMKDHLLRGSINGGGEPIEARTSGGSIRLRAAD